MSTNGKLNHIQQQAADQSLMDGLNKQAQTLSSFLVGSKTIKTTDIIAALQARIAAANIVQSTRATWQAAVLANANERASTKALVSGVKQALQVMYAGSIDTLAEFGLKPRKPRAALTTEQKVASAAKAKATRAARHTMGTQQKKAVKGTITTIVTSTPPAASPPIAPTASNPAASGPAQGPANAGATPRIP